MVASGLYRPDANQVDAYTRVRVTGRGSPWKNEAARLDGSRRLATGINTLSSSKYLLPRNHLTVPSLENTTAHASLQNRKYRRAVAVSDTSNLSASSAMRSRDGPFFLHNGLKNRSGNSNAAANWLASCSRPAPAR